MLNQKQYNLDGLYSNVELGKGGPRVIDNAGIVEVKNNAASAFAIVRGGAPLNDDDLVTKKYVDTKANAIVSDQIDGGAPPGVVNGQNRIVTTTGGAYTVKELWRGEAGVWVKITLIDGQSMQVTQNLAGGTDAYTGEHIYLWDATGGVWVDNGPISAFNRVTRNARTVLAFGDASPKNIGAQIPAQSEVVRCTIHVTAAFDGAPTLNIGDAGDTDAIMDNASINLAAIGLYIVNGLTYYAALTQLIATYVPGGATVGSAKIHIDYDTN